MNPTTKTCSLLAIALLTLSVRNLDAAPMGTAFTYQGLAIDNGLPATGLYNVNCELYDAPTAGNKIGPTLNYPGSTTDSNGVFTLTLDFGAGTFNGQARWLQFSVRTNGSIEPFTVLTPRQELTPAPAAIWAAAAGNLAGTLPSAQLAGNYSSAVTFNNVANNFFGNGSGLAYVNADLLDGYHSTAFALLGSSPNFSDITATRLNIGSGHSLSGSYATIPGGYMNQASASYSFAAGYRAKANHIGTFVWADNTAADFASGKANTFLIRSSGGVGINTNNPGAALDVHGSGTAIMGTTSQSGGNAIYGWAADNGSFRNYGGNFSASGTIGVGVMGNANGTQGIGVWGYAPSVASGSVTYGGYFQADGLECTGVYSQASAPGGTGVTAYGGTAGYDFYAAGPGQNYGSGSSIRWKKNIKLIDEPLAKLAALRGVYFNWDTAHGGSYDVGMIAEEVGKVMPMIVGYEANGVDATGMDYSKLTPLLVEASKALKTQVDDLCQQMAEKDARISALESDLTGLKALVNSLLEQAKGAGK